MGCHAGAKLAAADAAPAFLRLTSPGAKQFGAPHDAAVPHGLTLRAGMSRGGRSGGPDGGAARVPAGVAPALGKG